MTYRVVLSPVARVGLSKETRYSKDHWGSAHAKTYMTALKAKIAALKTSAAFYPVADASSQTRLMTFKGHRVAFIIDEALAQVLVLAVLSVYQDIDPERLKKR